MKKQSFILSLVMSFVIIFSSCKKEEEIQPENPVAEQPGGDNNGGGGSTTPPKPIVIAYTIKKSESTVDGSKLNLPAGSYVAIEAGQRGTLHLKNFEGAPGKPITFINAKGGQTVIKGSGWWALKTSECKNIRITGTGSSSSKYGILIDGGHNSFSLQDLSTDFEVDHVEVKNSGFAGIMAKTDPNCDSKTWRDNFTMRNISLHHNYIHDVGGEGFYIGNSFYADGRSESCGKVYPHEIHGLKLYENITKNTGCEGIQVGCATKGCEIYNNSIDNYGTDPFANYQNNGLQLGAGTGGKCFNNKIVKGPGNGIIVNGIGGNLIYNNLIVDAGSLGIFCDERSHPIGGYSFINNTIVNSGSDGMRLYSDVVPMNDVINNIIINPKSGKYINTSGGVKLNEKNNYTSMDVASAKFVNPSAGNYALSASSPAVNKGANTGSFGIYKDIIGKTRPSGATYDIGAYEY